MEENHYTYEQVREYLDHRGINEELTFKASDVDQYVKDALIHQEKVETEKKRDAVVTEQSTRLEMIVQLQQALETATAEYAKDYCPLDYDATEADSFELAMIDMGEKVMRETLDKNFERILGKHL